MTDPQTFDEFWPDYLAAHSDRRSRALHVAGTAAGLAFMLVFLATGHPGWAVAALVTGYGAAWTGHVLFERNIPKTLSHPLWSLRGDLRMLRLALLGRLEREIARVQASAHANQASD
ncbi:MAG: Mpo1-like protein [Hyphomicrobium sp.]|uniref:Mpo1-like protein n=1 Tax=Hyphomicrobium sp. TaxID=82 RepID=UPI003D0B1A24